MLLATKDVFLVWVWPGLEALSLGRDECDAALVTGVQYTYTSYIGVLALALRLGHV